MAILKEIKSENIVILAQNFNPSIFSTHWLVKNSLSIDDDIINERTIINPSYVRINTKQFNLVVTLDQLQIAPVSNTDLGDLIPVVKRIVEKLTEIPYKAIGINFIWSASHDSDLLPKFSRESFSNNSKLAERFKTDDSCFGIYMSKDIKNLRLKLDVKPTIENDVESMTIAFNYHKDFKNNDTAQIELIEILDSWKFYQNDSIETISLF